MKIEDWHRNERNTLTGPPIRTEFSFTTFETLGDTRKFLDYLDAYHPDVDAAKVCAAYEHAEDVDNARAFWAGCTIEDMIASLDEIFLSLDRTEVIPPKEIQLKKPMTWLKVDEAIRILRQHYGIFYKPEPNPLQPVIDQVCKWDTEQVMYDSKPVKICVLVENDGTDPEYVAVSSESGHIIKDFPLLSEAPIISVDMDRMVATDSNQQAYPIIFRG